MHFFQAVVFGVGKRLLEEEEEEEEEGNQREIKKKNGRFFLFGEKRNAFWIRMCCVGRIKKNARHVRPNKSSKPRERREREGREKGAPR